MRYQKKEGNIKWMYRSHPLY